MLQKGLLIISVVPKNHNTNEPWRYADFTKKTVIPELLSVYKDLTIIICDTLQAYNLEDWVSIPNATEYVDGHLFEQSMIQEAFLAAKENAKKCGNEMRNDLSDFLDLRPEISKRVSLLSWDMQDLKIGVSAFHHEFQDLDAPFVKDFFNCIDVTAHRRLEATLKTQPSLSVFQRKLIEEGSRHYLLEECLQFREILNMGIEDIWYPGTFDGKKSPVLHVCKKNGRQRFHRLDPNNPEAARLSIQKVYTMLSETSSVQGSDDPFERVVSKLDKANKALEHLQSVLGTAIHPPERYDHETLGLLEDLLDNFNIHTTNKIKEIRRLGKLVENHT